MSKIPVILDTDIGGDIDDTWALAYLLKCPELDLKMVLCSTEDSRYKAKIVAKLLEIAGRTDIPVAIGQATAYDRTHKTQATWVEDYELSTYPGKVYANGIAATVDAVKAEDEPVTLISIGPLGSVAAALELEPGIAQKCHFIGMHGSIARHHDGNEGAIPEYNVVKGIDAAKTVFAADWLSVAITPLDSCGVIRLAGERYQEVRACRDPLTAAVIENYRLWRHATEFDVRSSILYDTVAVFMGFSRQWLKMENMRIQVTDDGYTRVAEEGSMVSVATGWEDLDAFYDHLVERLCG